VKGRIPKTASAIALITALTKKIEMPIRFCATGPNKAARACRLKVLFV